MRGNSVQECTLGFLPPPRDRWYHWEGEEPSEKSAVREMEEDE